jgi:hypothetical protein
VVELVLCEQLDRMLDVGGPDEVVAVKIWGQC